MRTIRPEYHQILFFNKFSVDTLLIWSYAIIILSGAIWPGNLNAGLFLTGTEGGIRLYLKEIVELLQETLQSQSWTTKAQAATAMTTVAEKLGSNLGPPHLGNLMSALLIGLQGRTWEGKVSQGSVLTLSPYPAEPRYTLPLQTV